MTRRIRITIEYEAEDLTAEDELRAWLEGECDVLDFVALADDIKFTAKAEEIEV